VKAKRGKRVIRFNGEKTFRKECPVRCDKKSSTKKRERTELKHKGGKGGESLWGKNLIKKGGGLEDRCVPTEVKSVLLNTQGEKGGGEAVEGSRSWRLNSENKKVRESLYGGQTHDAKGF